MTQQEDYKKPENFRDKVSTIGDKGKRLWIFPRKPKGRYTQARSILSWFQLIFLLSGPFIKINGNPLLMLNIIERKFVIFGQVFWPQDFYLFALLLVAFFISIILFTAIWGRVWCGWLCPQTIFMEMLFRKIEYTIEGDFRQQKRLAEMPWNKEKIIKKGTKAFLFFAHSWVIGNVLLGYIIGGDALLELITDDPANHIAGLTVMALFTLAFFWLYMWFREQFCTFLCPYARLQSVMLDNNSIAVAYDDQRGEPRMRGKERKESPNAGDCVDCGICQQVCPTGIDIRNGFPQLECINCTACIDACDTVMTSVNKPRGLIRYASKNMIDNRTKFKITPRIIIYSTLLTALLTFCGMLLLLRSDVSINLMRERGFTYQIRPDGKVSNFYNALITNKSSENQSIKITSSLGEIIKVNQDEEIKAGEKTEWKFFIVADPDKVQEGRNMISINFYKNSNIVRTEEISFLAPGKGKKE
ncbi:MAG: cytochrome c oxidase accessory protein CcoG [Lentisphaeraceae bacterium]|nr:cytochrome c oxidase accessory protein CcoG [Lentisphaeraceae bacterium]